MDHRPALGANGRTGRRSGDERRLARLTRLARLLDARFRLPGTGIRFGIDGLVGLLPGIGDAATAALSLYVVAEGWRLGVRTGTLLRMLGNIAIDLVAGTIPLIGDIADIGWKANLRNIRLIERDIERRAPKHHGRHPASR